jgi:hypothetical protein
MYDAEKKAERETCVDCKHRFVPVYCGVAWDMPFWFSNQLIRATPVDGEDCEE